MLVVRQDAGGDAAADRRHVLLQHAVFRQRLARPPGPAPHGADREQGHRRQVPWPGAEQRAGGEHRAKVGRGGQHDVLHAHPGGHRSHAQAGLHAVQPRRIQGHRQDSQDQLRHRAAAAAAAAPHAHRAQQRGGLGWQARPVPHQHEPVGLHPRHVQLPRRDLRHQRDLPVLSRLGAAVELPPAQHPARARGVPRGYHVPAGGAGRPLRELP
mmetsp:Transcript_2412/g.4660  ORF Transcript_2412/g.4660 Transcript_2412/m.4660 type:complete len:212 (+) Transcript_2412:274-909(+)